MAQNSDFKKLLFANKYIELLKGQIAGMHIMLTAKKRDINPNLINDVITKLNREIKDLKKITKEKIRK